MNTETDVRRIAGNSTLPARLPPSGRTQRADQRHLSGGDGHRPAADPAAHQHPGLSAPRADSRQPAHPAGSRADAGQRGPATAGALPGARRSDYVTDGDGGFWRRWSSSRIPRPASGSPTRPRPRTWVCGAGRASMCCWRICRWRGCTRRCRVSCRARLSRPLRRRARGRAGHRRRRAARGAGVREERRAFVPVLEDARQAGKLRPRPIHGDPKLNNFLFEPEARGW